MGQEEQRYRKDQDKLGIEEYLTREREMDKERERERERERENSEQISLQKMLGKDELMKI